MTKDLPLKREKTKETTGSHVKNTHSSKPSACCGMQTGEKERGEGRFLQRSRKDGSYNEGRTIPTTKEENVSEDYSEEREPG